MRLGSLRSAIALVSVASVVAVACATRTVGKKVCWQNKGTHTHTVTDIATSGVRFNGSLPDSQAFIHSFGFGGSFEYRCNNHAGMTGTVIVNCNPGVLTC